jgi:hypothetical protein
MQCSSQLWKLKKEGYLAEHEYEFGVAQIETSSGIIFKDLFCHYLLICREQVQILK